MMHISKIERFLSWSVIQQKRKNGLCGWNAEAEARMIESKDWIRNKYGSVLCNNSEKHIKGLIFSRVVSDFCNLVFERSNCRD